MSDVLGAIDQLLIDSCILLKDFFRKHKRDLAVAYCDYQNEYGKVHYHYDWMLKVYTGWDTQRAL